MPWAALAFVLGVWGLQQATVLPAPTFLALGAVAGAGLWLAGRRRRILAILGALLLGGVWAAGWGHWRLADALPAEWEGRDVEVVGVVADLPQRFERGLRFVFEIEQSPASLPRKIALSWYRQSDAAEDEGDEEGAPPGALPMPRAGERWRFVVRLKRPHGSLNPYGFDYEGWLFERGIRATGYVRKSALTARWDAAGGISGAVGRLREATRARIERALPERPYAGIVAALAIGDQQAISPELWRLFAATGITHLMSISGLHVTMLGWLVAWLVSWLWRRSARLPLRWPAQKAAAVAGLAGAFGYALLAGFGVPAQRTLYMLGVVVAALLSGRAVAAPQVLGAALLLVLLLDPWAVLAAGFWLSFGAVALLFYISGGAREGHWLGGWLRAQWAMTLGLLPLLLALFQQFSLVSPFANALAIPVVSMAVTPLALLGCLPGFAWALDLAHGLLAPLMAFLQWLAGWPGAVWQQHAPPPWAVPVALLGAAWLLLPRGFPARRLGLVLFLPLFLIPPARPAPGEMTFTLLDVGQGQAVHVQTATRDLMFDAGPDFGGAADAGSRILVPYLRAAGVARLDRLIVSHADRDHAGGAASLLAAVPVGETLSSLQKSALAGSSWEKMAVPTFVKAHASVANVMPEQKSALAGRWCVDGESWEWDGVRFAILHPAPADYARKLPSNAMSCVLKIESAHGSVLIPGDLEGRAEAELLARHAGALHADVLVAPHHGGKRTSTPEFVAAVGAQEVLFPVGYRNRFGHPYADVLARYAASGARIHRTDADGAVRVAFDGAAAQIRHEREAARRYWHNAPLQPSGKPP